MGSKPSKRRLKRRREAQKSQLSKRRSIQKDFDARSAARSEQLDHLACLAKDPSTSGDVLARAIHDSCNPTDSAMLARGKPIGWYNGLRLGRLLGPVRGHDAASALSGDRGALVWWRAGMLAGAGDAAAADRVASEDLERLFAFEELDEELKGDLAYEIGTLRLTAGSPERAVEFALRHARQYPEHQGLQELLSEAVPELGRSARAQGLLNELSDRGRLYDLRAALIRFVAVEPDLAAWTSSYVAERADEYGHGRELPAIELSSDRTATEFEALERLWTEMSWHLGPSVDDNEDERGDDDCVLARFARSPSTPPGLVVLAESWMATARYGLWLIAEPRDAPGTLAFDLVTATLLYVVFAPEQIADVPRWSVLAGCVVNDAGVWRSGVTLCVLSPEEGDLASELAFTMTERLLGHLWTERHPRKSRALRRATMPSDTPPHSVLHGRRCCRPSPETGGGVTGNDHSQGDVRSGAHAGAAEHGRGAPRAPAGGRVS